MTSGRYLPAIGAGFVTCLIVSNIIAVKIGTFGPWALPVAVIVFPVAYIFGDILTGTATPARQVIWIGFACNAAVGAIGLAGGSRRRSFWTWAVRHAAIRAAGLPGGARFHAALLAASFLATWWANSSTPSCWPSLLATRSRWLAPHHQFDAGRATAGLGDLPDRCLRRRAPGRSAGALVIHAVAVQSATRRWRRR
jgi:hypothetical protein